MGTYCLADVATGNRIQDGEEMIAFFVEYAREPGVPIGPFAQFRIASLPIRGRWDEDHLTLRASAHDLGVHAALAATDAESLDGLMAGILHGNGHLNIIEPSIELDPKTQRYRAVDTTEPADWQIAAISAKTLGLVSLLPRIVALGDAADKMVAESRKLAIGCDPHSHTRWMPPSAAHLFELAGRPGGTEALTPDFNRRLQRLLNTMISRDASHWSEMSQLPELAQSLDAILKFRDILEWTSKPCVPSMIGADRVPTEQLVLDGRILADSIRAHALREHDFGNRLPPALREVAADILAAVDTPGPEEVEAGPGMG